MTADSSHANIDNCSCKECVAERLRLYRTVR